MTSSELVWLMAAEARRLLDRKEISSVELTEAHLDRINTIDGPVHSYLHVMTDVARNQAVEADARISRGEASILTGIPVALKDVLVTVDAPTTAASKILEGYQSPYDATVVGRLRS